jgi:hypothetical protein
MVLMLPADSLEQAVEGYAKLEDILTDCCTARTSLSYPAETLVWTTSLGTGITRPQAGAAGKAWVCLGAA